MGQSSSADLAKEFTKESRLRKRAIYTQIVLMNKQKEVQKARAEEARRNGNTEIFNQCSRSVIMMDTTLATLNAHITRIDSMSAEIGKQQATSLMVTAASDFVQVGAAMNKEQSTEEIKQIAAQYKQTNKGFEERNEAVEDMFETPDSLTMNERVEQLRAQIDDEIVLDTMRRLPDAKISQPTTHETRLVESTSIAPTSAEVHLTATASQNTL